MLKDIEIAQSAKMEKIIDIAKKINLSEDDIELYGKYKAKISLDVLKRNMSRKDGKLILVTAINPTPAGEGKSTTTIGLGEAFHALKKSSIIALREPSLGPVMGVKGGAAGGGYAQVVPMDELNLHFTGDIHAITCANNTICALIDNHIYQGNELNIDPENITFKRCLDINDRALREVMVGLGGAKDIKSRKDGFNISVASEIMAIICLSKNFNDLKQKISRIVIGFNYDKKPVTVNDLGCSGAIALLLKEAIKPNLVQTLENSPAIVHGGPFANIAHGCNSIIATKTALKLADYVITEAGFGADLGCEKFMDIKCREADIKPSAVVIVATIRALKMHGGMAKKYLDKESIERLKNGLPNLEKHIETVKAFNVSYIVCINKYEQDSEKEIAYLEKYLDENNHPYSLSECFKKGSSGAIDLANKVIYLTQKENNFKFLYELDLSIEDKILKIAKTAYGAMDVVYTEKALKNINDYTALNWDKLPICIAKTPLSLTDDPKIVGRPKDFIITVTEIRPSIGAGFLVALTGDIMTMPGLPKDPAAMHIDIDEDGTIVGLF